MSCAKNTSSASGVVRGRPLHRAPPTSSTTQRPRPAPSQRYVRVNANIAHSGHNRAEPVRGDGRNTGENED